MDRDDWLWRLDCIEGELAKLLPDKNLYVAFSVRTDFNNACDPSTFPYGHSPASVNVSAPKYTDPETGALWFDLGRFFTGPIIVCAEDESRWSLHHQMPEGFAAQSLGEPFASKNLEWCTWYYFKATAAMSGKEREDISRQLATIEDAILELCANAPDVVHSEIETGDFPWLQSWPTALFYLAMARTHPLLQVMILDPSSSPMHRMNPVGLDVSEGKYSNRVYVHEPIKMDVADNSAEIWFGQNDYVVRLSVDLRTATEHAFVVLRKMASRPPEAESGIQVVGPVGNGDCTCLEKARTYLKEHILSTMLPGGTFTNFHLARQEALVYWAKQGHDVTEHVDAVVRVWKEERDLYGGREYPKTARFWSEPGSGQFFLDATILRTAEICGIGGFESCWQKLAGEIQRGFVEYGGWDTVTDAYYVFAMSRSDLALRLMRDGLAHCLHGIRLTGSNSDVPWLVSRLEDDDSTTVGEDVGLAASVLFASCRVQPEAVEASWISSAAEFLMAKQTSEGGWPDCRADGESRIEVTAMAIHGLAMARAQGWERSARIAAHWLWQQQDDDGSWWEDTYDSEAYLTVLVLDAIELAGGGTRVTFRMDPDRATVPDSRVEPRVQAEELIVDDDRNWLKKAEGFLKNDAQPLEYFGDAEAIVYLISRGISCHERVNAMVDFWKETAKGAISRFAKPIYTTDYSGGKPKPGEMVREGIPDEQAQDVARWPSMKLGNFWSWHDCQEATIDATMLRAVEWAAIGGLDAWWQRLAKEITEYIAHHGVGDLDAAYRIFALSRSEYALRLLGHSMVQYIWALTIGTNDPAVPWNVLVDCGMDTQPRDSIVMAASIVFGSHRIRNHAVDTGLLDKAVRFIREHQSTGGGWSLWADWDKPEIEPTAMALHAICVAKPLGWEHTAAAGAEWLREHQDSDGSWAEPACPDAAYLTVLALDAIELAGGGTRVTFRMNAEGTTIDTESLETSPVSADKGVLPEEPQRVVTGDDRKAKEPEWIRIADAARILTKNPGVISRWASEGKIRDNGKTHGDRRVNRADILRIQREAKSNDDGGYSHGMR